MQKATTILLLTLSTFSSFFFLITLVHNTEQSILFTLFLIIPFYHLFKMFISSIKEIQSKHHSYIHLFVIFFSITLFFGFFKDSPLLFDSLSPKKFLLNMNIIFLIFCLTTIYSNIILKVSIDFKETKIPIRNIFLYSFPMIFIWSIYLIAYYPGVMSIDSLNQWWQILEGIYGDGHPLVHTLLLKLLISIWPSPAIVAIAQILITALVISFGFYSLASFGINKKLIIIGILFFTIFPTFGFMSVILWKDIIFSAFLLLFTILVINIVTTKGSYLNSKRHLIFIIIVSSIICLFRHNGMLSFVGTMILLLFFYRKHFKPILLIIISTFIIYGVVKGPIFTALDVSPTNSNEIVGIPTQQIAAVIKKDGNLTDGELDYLEKILPINDWIESYNTRSVDTLKMHPNFNRHIITDDMSTFLKTWFHIVKQNPRITTQAYADQTALIWRYNSNANLAHMKIFDNGMHLENIVLSSTITNTVNALYEKTKNSVFAGLFWRPALFMYLAILFTFIAIRRNSLASIIVIVPMLLNILTYLLAIPAPDFRYLYSNLLILPFIILFSFIKFSKEE